MTAPRTVLFTIGQDVAVNVTTTDAGGNLVAPTAIAVTVIDPNGVTLSTVSLPSSVSTGTYQAVVSSVATAGTYEVRWAFTLAGAHGAYEDQFSVRPQGVTQVVDLGSVKAQLNFQAGDTSQDGELIGYIVAATEMIRDICGPIVPETHTQWMSGGGPRLSLDWQPLVSVTSVTEYYGLSAFVVTEQPLGGQANAFGFTTDLDTAVLTRRTIGGDAALWPPGSNNIKIVYVAGRTSTPFLVRLAALELVQHWWKQSKQAKGRARGALDDGAPASAAFGLPNSVEDKLAPWRRPPGVA